MQALGFIETRGLIVAIESADIMLKAAEVTLIEKTNVGGGLVSITITGDVAAVKAAVEAGAAAVEQLKSDSLISQHVIPRPHEELDGLIGLNKSLKNNKMHSCEPMGVEQENEAVVRESVIEETNQLLEEKIIEDLVVDATKRLLKGIDIEVINKNTIDNSVLEYGIQETLEFLSMQPVIILRKLSREYKKLGLAGRSISKANKEILLTEFQKYFKNNTK